MSLSQFVSFVKENDLHDEKSHASLFLDQFFRALGHTEGIAALEAGGLEQRVPLVRQGKPTTGFIDLYWPGRVIIEMKSAGRNLGMAFEQVRDYWYAVAHKPQYVVLCNFKEFWIYEFLKSPYDPIDVLTLDELPQRPEVFNFLLPTPRTPVFNANRDKVTREATRLVAEVFKNILGGGIPREVAFRFSMQCVLAMFAEDIGLLPNQLFTRLVQDYKDDNRPHLLPLILADLFQEMSQNKPRYSPYFKGVPYFNGGLFQGADRISFHTPQAMSYLLHAAQMDWSSVNPLIFGSLFEAALEKDTRHTLGAHYTGEDQINRIVYPTLVKPLLAQLAMAHNPQATYALLERIRSLRVLDPACGSGNFLFVAYRKLREVEREVLAHLREQEAQCNNLTHLYNYLAQRPYVSIRQFYGLEKNPESAELARLALVIAKELEWHHANTEGLEIYEEPLPLDDMHQNILCTDALVSYDANGNPYPTPWPAADVIIGNPPYQSKNKMQEEYGASYVDVLQQLYGNAVPGRADYCVYWFRRAHDHLPPLGRAGLVGTNTIRQNYSREGSLDYILRNGGTLTDAVASQEWPGEAAVHVSIACWTKGPATGPFTLWTETGKNGNTELVAQEVPALNASLSLRPDVTTAHVLACNQEPKLCFQGQTHGHEGFLVPAPEAERLLAQHPEYAQVLKPFLIGEELVGNPWSQPKRFVIDFSGMELQEASAFKKLFAIVKNNVLPTRKARAEEQEQENAIALEKNPKIRLNKHHINFYNRWWRLGYEREDLFEKLQNGTRYIASSRVQERMIFEFVDASISPNDALMAFVLADDYSFGIISSVFHWEWYKEKGSTLNQQYRYTTLSVWDTFPWPQQPSLQQVQAVAAAAVALRAYRHRFTMQQGVPLRDLYRTLELPGKNPLRDHHAALDEAVRQAYGFSTTNPDGFLHELLALNHATAERTRQGLPVQGPGLPACVPHPQPFITQDCIRWRGVPKG